MRIDFLLYFHHAIKNADIWFDQIREIASQSAGNGFWFRAQVIFVLMSFKSKRRKMRHSFLW
jgi:hypothetical protein